MTVYEKDYHVDLSDVDFMKRLRMSTLFEYFQDVASLAAADLGFGIDTLAEQYGVAWVLMKIRVDVERQPFLNENITIETWPQEPNRVYFERDYLVKDEEGNTIIRAISSWVLMDLAERKLCRSNTIPYKLSSVRKTRAIDDKLGRLRGFTELETVYQKVIGYSDIDFNGHLNNSSYVDFVMDCFSVEEHKANTITSMEIHFLREALPGEVVTLKKDLSRTKDNFVYIEGTNDTDDGVIFKGKMNFDPV